MAHVIGGMSFVLPVSEGCELSLPRVLDGFYFFFNYVLLSLDDVP